MARRQRQRSLKAVETLTHEGENRKNIPTAEYQPVMRDEELNPVQVAYERREGSAEAFRLRRERYGY